MFALNLTVCSRLSCSRLTWVCRRAAVSKGRLPQNSNLSDKERLHRSRLRRSRLNVCMQVKPSHRPCLNTPAAKIAGASRNCQDVATHCERSPCLNSVISLFAQRAASHLYSQLSPADATTRRKASPYTVRLKRDLFRWVVGNLFPPAYGLRCFLLFFFSIWLWDRVSLCDGISWP